MKVYAVRHGQAEHNRQWRLNDDPQHPSDLTVEGRRHAQQLAAQLKNVPFERIFTSELPRTQQTAAIINQNHDAPVEHDARLNDVKTGYGGRPVWRWILRQLITSINNSHPRGESLEEARIRVNEFVEELRKRPYRVALVVAHQHTLQTLISILGKKKYWHALKRPISHTTLLEFDLD